MRRIGLALAFALAACSSPPLEPGVGSFDDGVYHVGTDIIPGTYRTREVASRCYWERLRGFSGTLDDIIENYLGFGWAETGDGYAIVTIAPTDAGFSSEGCGHWTADLSAVTNPDGPISEDGAFIVGTDIAPGTWRSTGDVRRAVVGDDCFVVRLSGFGGSSDEIIAAYSSALGGLTVTIAGDRGFETVGCGTWTRVEGSSTPGARQRSLVESQLRGSRQPVLDALADLGYECDPEQPHPGDLPTIHCSFPGAADIEGVLMFATTDDFRGVGLITYDTERLADFFATFGSPEISQQLIAAIEETIRLGPEGESPCPLPCQALHQGGPLLGNEMEARTEVREDLLIIGVLQEVGF